MKKCSFLLGLLISVQCLGQQKDSCLKPLSKNALILSFGHNLDCATGQYLPYGPWGSIAISSSSPLCALSFSHAILRQSHVEMGFIATASIVEYDYLGSIAWEISYGPPIELEKIEELELRFGVYSKIMFHHIGWYNEFSLCQSSEMSLHDYYNSPWNSGNEIYAALPFGYFSNWFLLYQTGLCIQISKHFTAIPMIGFPLVNFTQIWYNSTSGFYGYSVLQAFFSFRQGVQITYNF